MRQLVPLLLLALLAASIPTAAQSDADNCAPSRLEVWAQAQVPLGDRINRLRAAPSTNSLILEEVPPGVPVDVLDGPVCSGDVLWWEVESRGEIGWTAEAQGDTYFLERVGNNCPPSELVPGGAATFANPDINTINRHDRPRLDAPAVLYTADNPSIFLASSVTNVCAQDARWWFVSTPDGSGWTTETLRETRRLKPYPLLARKNVGEIVAPPAAALTLDPTGYTLAWRSPLPNSISASIPHVWTMTIGVEEADALSGPIRNSEIDLHWSPDGSRLAYQVILGGGRRDVMIDALDGSEPLAVETDLKGFLGFTPDGARLLWRSEDEIEDYRLQDFGYTDIATGEHTRLPAAPDGFYRFLRWVDADTFEALRYDSGGANINRVAVSLDGTATVTDDPWGFELEGARDWWYASPGGRYAFTPRDRVLLFDPATRTTDEIWNVERTDSALTWSPDETRIAFYDRDGQVYVLDVATGAAVVLPESDVYFAYDEPVAWSPDGLFVAYMTRNRALVVQQADGGAPPIEIARDGEDGFFSVEDIRFRSGTPE